MWPMLIMAGISAIQNADKEKRQTALDSASQRYSPWTKMSLAGTGEVHDPNTAGTASQALGAYEGQQQNNAKAAAQQKLMEAQIRALDRGGYGGDNVTFRSQSPMIGTQNASQSPWMAALNSNLGSGYSY